MPGKLNHAASVAARKEKLLSGNEKHDAFRADLDQAQASARDSVPIVTTMYLGFRREGLGFFEAVFLSAAWIWTAGHPKLNRLSGSRPFDDTEDE